jgi:hypothetical protein
MKELLGIERRVNNMLHILRGEMGEGRWGRGDGEEDIQ